jgi:uncharacterized membrane protein
MTEFIHASLLWIHIPAGFLSLLLFWIPVGLKKGSPLHRKVGRYYYYTMWTVVLSAVFLSICNTILGAYIEAAFLGYLSIITAYPLWYSYEILQQDKQWSNRYILIRKIFVTVLFFAGISMILLGVIGFNFEGMGVVMVFFGAIALPSGRDIFMDLKKAMSKESKLKMHIQGTIISGIAAYTAFFAFGGARIMVGVLGINHQWMIIPWLLPSVLGFAYSRYMKRQYAVS